MDTISTETTPAQAANIQDTISRLLHANDSHPGFMYASSPTENQVEEAPPQQTYQQAPAYTPEPTPEPTYSRRSEGPSSEDLIAALQYERSRNEQLARQAEILRSYEKAFEEDPALSQGLINYFTTGQSALGPQTEGGMAEGQPAPSQTRQVVPPILRKQIENLQQQVGLMQLHNEASELERQYPGVFQRGPVAQHMQRTGKSSLREAFHDLLGTSVSELIRAQQMQQYAQQMQAWQHLQSQYYGQASQGYQQQTPQTYQQQPAQGYQQQATAPGSVTSVNPPPAHDTVISRPGAGVPSVDPFDNVKPKTWQEAQALMLHDMKRAGFPV